MNTEVTTVEMRNLETSLTNTLHVKTLHTVSDYVKAGRFVLHSMNCHQAIIAQYALKVCTIRHGGISNNIYTLKNYASDIGIPFKTLQNWTLIYRKVLTHLDIPVEKITSEDWKKSAKLAWLEKGRTHSDNLEKGTTGKRDNYKEEKIGRTPEQIKHAFNNMEEVSVASEVVSWNYQFNQIKTKLFKRDLTKVDDYVLLELMQHCDVMSDFINDYLTEQKRKH